MDLANICNRVDTVITLTFIKVKMHITRTAITLFCSIISLHVSKINLLLVTAMINRLYLKLWICSGFLYAKGDFKNLSLPRSLTQL